MTKITNYNDNNILTKFADLPIEQQKRWIVFLKAAPFIYILFFILLAYVLTCSWAQSGVTCSDNCSFQIVESIPEGLSYPPGSPKFLSTFSAWKDLIDNAEENIELGVFYWSLNNHDVTPLNISSARQGEEVFNRLLIAGKEKNVKIRIAQNAPTATARQIDSHILQIDAGADVVNVNMKEIFGGVLHTKIWVVDGKHVYIGSANMDWRSLTQVKEAGILIKNCTCIANDARKIIELYRYLGINNQPPPKENWPKNLQTAFTMKDPGFLFNSSHKPRFFLSGSPPLDGNKRTDDAQTILHVISSARKFVYIAVMDYFPRFLYIKKNVYWPLIDNALRKVALEKNVTVRLLASHWNHTRKDMVRWLKSLQDVSGGSSPRISIETKLFVVPTLTPEQGKIPFARVNHNKYLVTDEIAYFGTSNWSGDYFHNTAGVGLFLNETETNGCNDTSSTRYQLQSLFERDWNSEFAKPIEEFL